MRQEQKRTDASAVTGLQGLEHWKLLSFRGLKVYSSLLSRNNRQSAVKL